MTKVTVEKGEAFVQALAAIENAGLDAEAALVARQLLILRNYETARIQNGRNPVGTMTINDIISEAANTQ